MNKRLMLLGIATCFSFVFIANNANANNNKVTLDVASTFPETMAILGEAVHELADKVARITAGNLEIRVHGPGELAPASETLTAVSDGRIAAAWAGAGWLSGKDTAFNFFSSVPFGPAMGEYLAWMYEGGGLELARDMFRSYGVYNIPCGLIPPEASGWFQKEIRSPEDLKGMNMRFFGLGALVMQKLGVTTEQIAPGEILAKLQDGSLDATEFSLPAMDQPLGFHKVAKYYYFPGWHQQATLFDLDINLDVWNGLSEQHQAAIEIACGDVMRQMASKGEAIQWQTLKDLQENHGVELRRWPAPMLVEMEEAWLEIVAEESVKNPNFKKVYESYNNFRENYRIWRYLSYL